MEDTMRRRTLLTLLLLLGLAGITTAFYLQSTHRAFSYFQTNATTTSGNSNATYIYYTLKQSSGFVLARAPKGNNGQPLSTPQTVAQFSDGFGQLESDSVLSMQLSPDGRYLAIDGTRDHGEQVWVYATQQMSLKLLPPAVLGNFLNWIPGQGSHSFLYRPMLPLGPDAPMDGSSWNPGLWVVDAATGTHRNIDIAVPSAYLIDAAASPDGSHIVYSTTAGLGMGSDTWLMNSDGSSVTHLFRNTGTTQSIAALFKWSPDRKTIAYERLADSSTPFLPAGLWIMNAVGGQQMHLADADGGHGYAPAWSPDGRKIAFVMRTNTSDLLANMQMQALQSAIAVVDVPTSRSWVVASATQTGMQLNYNPVWSADSTSITFTASNPVNAVLGGSPRYWSARALGSQMQPSVLPLTPSMSHVIAGS